MKENMDTTETGTQTGNMGDETELQGMAPDGKGKLFTQDEVNSFVQSRIARLKGQINKDLVSQYDQKVAELQAREMKLMVREKLDAMQMPRELADCITCTDENDLTSKLEILRKIYGSSAIQKVHPTGFVQVGAAATGYDGTSGTDPVRKAMGLE